LVNKEGEMKKGLKELCSIRDSLETLEEHKKFIGVDVRRALKMTKYHIKHYEQYQKKEMGL